MNHFSPLRARTLARIAVLVGVLIAGLGLRPEAAWASHIRAGDIQAKLDTTANPNPRRVFFKMILYLDIVPKGSQPLVDQPAATIFFGDGTSSCKDAVPRLIKRAIPGNADTNVNVYLFEHTYGSAGSFNVEFIGENRNAGALNMTRSEDQTFYIRTTISLQPSLGLNRSPVLTAPAIDKGAIGQVFLHNPGAFDADGDSLVYKLTSCQQVPAGVDGSLGGAPCSPPGTGNNQPRPVNCTNYRLPNDPAVAPNPVQVPYNGVPPGVPGAPAVFVIDANTGQITWNAPVAAGLYNVALVVEEWRRTTLSKTKIGEVVRDMQITIVATNNRRPIITIPADICVVAGERVTGTVTAVDDGSGAAAQTPIDLFAYSGIIPPATFTQTQKGPPQASGTFNWQTDCSNVARLPYQVVFKAQDTPTGAPTTNPILIDEKTWRITVVGPPPQNLRAAPISSGGINSVVLNWNLYQCANASRIFIYRKVDRSNFNPGPCETGIPASAGYTLVNSVPANATTFTDSNVGANGTVIGLDRGKTYCYRIYAEFPLPAGGASIASLEACAFIGGRSALLTNVDVETTSPATGQITVRWTQPRTASGTPFDGTSTYVLSRAEGLNPAATAFTPVRAPFTNLADTSYVDNNLNTLDRQYTYKLEFIRTFAPGTGATVTEVSPTASSVRTNAVPADASATRVTVSWTYNVPWDNTNPAQPTVIYRRTGNTGPFTRIGTAPSTATGGTYTDADPALRKGETYCYYVQTNGRYASFNFLSSLLNKSQERCLVLVSPPCTPILALQATNCDSLASLQEFPKQGERYSNRLRWTLSNRPTGCDATIASYRVYYRPTPTGRFGLIGTTPQTSFVHGNLEFSGGCYAVQAVAPSGLVSDTSNVACQDNCVFFVLPNIFTPNGDNQNAVFRPKNNSPVRSIRFKAFNRWGVKLFENTTTSADAILINWDGGGPSGESGIGSKGKVSDGIYYYLAEVEFADFANTRRTYKGWVEIVR